MPLLSCLSRTWAHIQGNLFPWLTDELGRLTATHKQVVTTLEVAGVEAFLNNIGAQQMVQNSPNMDKLAGTLDRLLPGLGNAARQQTGAGMSLGINLLGEQTTLEGKRAVTLPLRFDDGSVFLGPIQIGNAPALF